MTTTRERRERRAEKLREWAEGREAKSNAAHEASRDATAGIPFGQPILVGHHSERRHRNAVERGQRQATAAVDHARKADDMASRAANIEAANAAAIYTDDEDAAERLAEKIATLEAKREQMKAANAAFRKEHRAELKGKTTYERSCAVPFPSYAITNLTGNIGRLRKRLEDLPRAQARAAEDRTITARYGGSCADCGADIERGQTIRYSRENGARCAPDCNGGEATC